MSCKGIVRKFDELGRVMVPKEFRNFLDMNSGSSIQIYISDNKIIMEKFESSCLFCDSIKGLLNFNEKTICKKCLKDINSLNNKM